MEAVEAWTVDLERRLAMAAQAPRSPLVPVAPAAAEGVFRREGELWTIAYDGDLCRLRDLKGLRYLAHLLRHAEHEIHVLDLVAVTEAEDPAARPAPSGSAGPVLDARAKAEYRQRLEDLGAELAEAEDWADVGRVARTRAEIEAVSEQLATAVGIGGRDREAASVAERARSAVTQSIRAAIRKITDEMPRLGALLAADVRTGTFCEYRPVPGRAVLWRFERQT